ncbi:MAG: hypothetical protein JWO63_1398 [Frankiales bacterium]|nr:hypothetical protein [Frankiales bacterium]
MAAPVGPDPVISGRAQDNNLMAAAMLNDLLNNALDPGYRARSGAGKKRHWWDGPMVLLVCVAAGLLLVTAYQQTHRSAPASQSARQDLESRIRNLQSEAVTMDDEAKQLAAQVAALRDQQLPAGDDSALRGLELAAGSIAVTGPGVSIEVGEPKQSPSSASTGRTGTASQPQDSVLRDRDIRAIVNQLWTTGAEAIAVNGIRLTATSAIRFAGESILVDFQTLSSPYTVEAVGDRNKMLLGFADSATARKFKTEEAVYGISFTFSGKSKLTLPSVTVMQQSDASLGPAPSSTPASSPAPTPTEHPS